MITRASSSRKGGANRGASTDTSDAIPLRYGDDPYVWACWLYYEDGMTQGEIADAMGVSRATVNSYLAEAREKDKWERIGCRPGRKQVFPGGASITESFATGEPVAPVEETPLPAH